MRKKILLGVTGGIAAYKAAILVRLLREVSYDVRVVMTKSACAFVTPLTFQALSGHPVHTDLFDEMSEQAMGHIELAKWADIVLIAPLTADMLAQLSLGLAQDLLSTLMLVFRGPIYLCPSMNQAMWHHAVTVEHRSRLTARGVYWIGPESGSQACGDVGLGRMTEPDDIVKKLLHAEVSQRSLEGVTVIITAGPTREMIDPVRYLSNRSSGKMGFALAKAASRAGAHVVLITGPTAERVPSHVCCVSVFSAEEMYQAVMDALGAHPGAVFIGAAAVADYRVKMPEVSKIKKTSSTYHLVLERTPDILKAVVVSHQASYVVGFAAETDDVLRHARSKLVEKKVDMIVANKVGLTEGFDVDEHEVIVLTSTDVMPIEKTSKDQIAVQLIEWIATHRLLQER